VKPNVKFGISPFGIWKNGVPSGIVGLDAYDVLFADAVGWLDKQWIDYLTPQLYWAFGGGQDYGKLAPWWAEQTARNARHLYPGHAVYKATDYSANELPRQVRLNREHPDIQGSVFFRTRNITIQNSKGFADSLSTDLYRYPALTPTMDWNSLDGPPAVTDLVFEWTGSEEVTLSWSVPEAEDSADVRRFAIYRVRAADAPSGDSFVADARNLI